jgi:uncharacterized membrane protein YdjX (TVP38/TMEM64 family)
MPLAERIKARLRSLDSRAVFMIGIAFFAFGTALTLILFGSAWLAVEGEGDVAAMLAAVDDPVLAPLAVILVYVGLGALGAPQFLLQAAAIVVFGPWLGFAYAWGATMVSSSVFYWAGYISGAQALRRFAGVRVNSISEALGRHGILATAVSRVVPTMPFVILNMAFGASHVNFVQFLVGTGLGTIPKVAVVAYVGASLGDFLASRDPMDLALMAVILLLWIGFAWWLRRVMKRSGWQKAVEDAVETPEEAQADAK